MTEYTTIQGDVPVSGQFVDAEIDSYGDVTAVEVEIDIREDGRALGGTAALRGRHGDEVVDEEPYADREQVPVIDPDDFAENVRFADVKASVATEDAVLELLFRDEVIAEISRDELEDLAE